MKKKLERREATRERKALAAAHLEKSIEKELIERLKTRAYGDAPLNVNESVWQAVLDQSRGKSDKEKILEDGLEDLEDDESEEEDEEELEGEFEEDDEWGDREFVSDLSGDESEDGLSDLEEAGEGRDMEEFGTDEDDEDVEESDGEEASKKGKRKAPPVPRKAKKRPEKKAKRTSFIFSLYFTPLNRILFNDRRPSCGSRVRGGICTSSSGDAHTLDICIVVFILFIYQGILRAQSTSISLSVPSSSMYTIRNISSNLVRFVLFFILLHQ